jgi:hypothetical protein
VTGKLTTPEQVEEASAGLRPTEVVKLQEFRERWQAAEMNDLINSPEHQAQVLGEFDRLLADYVPITGDSPDMPAVELGALMKLVPAGPLREDMDRRLQAVAANQKAEAANNLDLMLDQVTAAAKSGKLGKVSTPEVFDTDRAITRGFLTGTEGLQSLGFSKKEAAAIASADNDFERQKLFRESWKTREGSDENATPWARAAAGAILDRSGTFTVEPAPDDFTVAGQQAEIDLKVGQIRAGMTEWARRNPELARDPEKIRAELHKRTGMELRKPVRRIAPPPGKVPTETSMNSLPAPLQPLAPVFEQAGRAHGIDPRFLMAISMHETANGKSSAFRNKRNAMGVSNSKGPIAFEDPAESVHRMARVLASPKGPYRNARTLAQIGQVYAPIGAGNDPRSLNQHWTAGVSKYLRQLGGDPNQIFLKA